jgi:hypothetical protein
MIGKVILTGGNKCPTCGKVFTAEAPLTPNTEDREFYGGRIKFFKEVNCDCGAHYKLCIEKKFDTVAVEEKLNVINMIIMSEGTPIMKQIEKTVDEKMAEAVKQAKDEKGSLPTLGQRQELKKQTILASIIDLDVKIDTLCLHTLHELQVMCRQKKIKVGTKDTKKKLAEKLLAADPNLVVANPEG